MVEAIFALFFHGHAWPRFVDLDRFLDRRGEAETEAVLVGLPPGLVYGVSGHTVTIHDDQVIALSVAALLASDQGQEFLQAFLAAIRYAADLEHRREPEDPPAELSSETIAESIAIPAAGRADFITCLGELLRVENWGWSRASYGNGSWSFAIDRRIRRFRGVESIQDYWIRAHPDSSSDYGVVPSTLTEGTMEGAPAVSVFISYAHADKPVARAIAESLGGAGARVWIDEGELRAGDSIIERIATAIADVQFVVAIVSAASVESQWCKKELALALTGGFGREGVKLLPLRLGDVMMPSTLTDLYYLQVDPRDPAGVTQQLIRDARSHADERSEKTSTRASSVTAAGRSIQGAGQSSLDDWDSVTATGYGTEIVRRARAGVTPAQYAREGLPGRANNRSGAIAERGPVTLVGIVREGIGRPRNDGTRGSGLYSVPFRLSRTATRDWGNLLEATWDRPPEFTTMHRPGVCRVSGNVITLDGVTIGEVEQYHLKTLKLCIDRTNELIDQQEQRTAATLERARGERMKHDAAIEEAIDRLDFN